MMFIRLWVFFAGVLLVLFLGWAALVAVPGVQIANVPPQPDLRPYTHEEAHGREVYIREGCMYCHTQQTRPVGFGDDQGRRWGRPSVPGDYYYDKPHLVGTMRTGPDLLNIGARQPSRDWHLAHLRNPRAVVKQSIMPPFPWLFDARTGEPTAEGENLYRYLLSLNRTYPVRP